MIFKLTIISFNYFFSFNPRISLIYDNLTLIVPIILFVTIFSDAALYFWLVFILVICLTLRFIKLNNFISPSELHEPNDNSKSDARIIKITIRTFRMLVVVISSVCILAVDFFVFPGKHAKTLQYGFSLMDVGVGYFILCHSTRIFNSEDIQQSYKFNNLKKL